MSNQLLTPSPCCNPCCPTTLLNLQTIVQDLVDECCVPGTVVQKDTVADMRAVLLYNHDWLFRTLGGAAVGDGFGKDWYYDPASLAVDDGTAETVVIRFDNKPIGEPGRLLQQI